MNKQQHDTEKEIKKIAGALLLNEPTTTIEGMREYKRLERQIQKVVKSPVKINRWQKIRQNIMLALEQMDEDLNKELVFRKKKR